MTVLKSIEFYEDRRPALDVRTEITLRFRETDIVLRTGSTYDLDNVWARAVPVDTWRLSDGTEVAVSSRIKVLYHTDAARLGIDPGQPFIVTT